MGLDRAESGFGDMAHSITAARSRAGKLEPTLSLAALPPRPFTLMIDSATMAVDGPWQLSWEAP